MPKIGYEKIQNLLEEQFYSGGGTIVKFRGGAKKYFKDVAKEIVKLYETEEDNMQTDLKAMALARGISQEVIKYTDRICRAFSFSIVQLDPIAVEVYEWMMEQEQKGQTVEKFAEWARDPERVKFINKYRNSAGNFKNDWPLAFTATKRSIYEE